MISGVGRLSKILFVTGRLAHNALLNILKNMDPPFLMKCPFAHLRGSMNVACYVAAEERRDADVVILPGLCQGDEKVLAEALGVEVKRVLRT